MYHVKILKLIGNIFFRYFKFEPSLKLRCRAQGFDGSRVPVTTGTFRTANLIHAVQLVG